MPWNKVMDKWKSGDLHSGSKTGPKVSGQKQAVAIMLSEKRAAEGGKSEYAAKKETSTTPHKRLDAKADEAVSGAKFKR